MASRTPPSIGPEGPWEPPDLSPRPVPNDVGTAAKNTPRAELVFDSLERDAHGRASSSP
jgi:hypothetical protein